MDGRTVQHMRLLEKTTAELKTQNIHLSAQLLEMADQLDKAVKASHVDRLLNAAMLAEFGKECVVHLAIPNVDAMRMLMSQEPGVAIHTSKDLELGVWVIELRENPPASRNVFNCAGCRKDHVDIPQREVTEAETARGVLWVGVCPETQKEVFAFAERPKDPAPATDHTPLIQVVR